MTSDALGAVWCLMEGGRQLTMIWTGAAALGRPEPQSCRYLKGPKLSFPELRGLQSFGAERRENPAGAYSAGFAFFAHPHTCT
eukprot:12317895-Alexandrium_andersonii.AAC.1